MKIDCLKAAVGDELNRALMVGHDWQLSGSQLAKMGNRSPHHQIASGFNGTNQFVTPSVPPS